MHIFGAFFIFNLTASVIGQTTYDSPSKPSPETCRLAVSELPPVNGFRLGMSVRDLEKITGNRPKLAKETSKVYKNDETGLLSSHSYEGKFVGEYDLGIRQFAYYSSEGQNPRLPGIERVIIWFHDDSAYSFAVYFNNDVFKETDLLGRFTAFTDKFNIAKNIWTIGTQEAYINCINLFLRI